MVDNLQNIVLGLEFESTKKEETNEQEKELDDK